MSDFINEKFSTRAKGALKAAQKIAQELGSPRLGTEHLLYGIVSEISSFASEVLLKNRLSPEAIRLEIVRDHNASETPAESLSMSANLRTALEKAAMTAAKYQYQFIGTEHFLFGLVGSDSNTAQKILQRLRIDPHEIKKNLLSIFENVSKFPENPNVRGEPIKTAEDASPHPHQVLPYFTSDLTEKAKNGLVDPLIGREREVQRLISILNRRTKNNPVLIGEPGVGKTAIVEGLALAIRDRKVPENLLDKRILALDLALVVAGSMFRGEFENRLKQIIEEIKDADDIILFIDELHTLVGAGATTGSLDAANILKPALARGELRAIGATTLAEYKKYIEPDAALERRFQPIIVKEPSIEETYQILQGLRPFYESHHEVEITDEALRAAIKLSDRYIADRFLPDKAIDLVDETAAFYKMIGSRSAGNSSLKTVERDLEDLLDQKKQAVFEMNFTAARALRLKETELLKSKHKMLKSDRIAGKKLFPIKGLHVAETVTRITGIPSQTLLQTEKKRLLSLEKNLKKHLVGQDQVLRLLAASIRRSRAGLSSHDRPLGSFMFLGPSGVGKTLTAKLLASEIFESERSLLRIDMSEFMERHNVARLIGAPAGYIGYEEGGKLTEAIRRQPYAVVLFDEIEKAHSDVFNILLQILEEGELTDAAGKKVNFRNTIIILTSNIGLYSFHKWAKSFGFSGNEGTIDGTEIKEHVLSKVRTHFRPEFLNRIDQIVVFEPLQKTHIKKVVTLELKKLEARLAGQGIALKVPAAVVRHLTEKSFDPVQGARAVRKNLQDLVEDKIASAVLEGRIRGNQTCKLILSNKDTIEIQQV